MQKNSANSFGGHPEQRVDAATTRRLRILARIAIGWAFVVILRLLQLQVFSHSDYQEAARSQQEQLVEIPAPRGAILDREERTLAMSTTLKSVAVNPRQVPDVALASEVLARVLNIDAADLASRMQAASGGGRGFLWIKRRITTEEAERVRSLKLSGIELRDENLRTYPKGSLASHLLGFVDFEEKGMAGIELGLEDDLEGIPGIMRVLRDVTNRGYESTVETRPQPGKNVVLTIDERIQYIAERELQKAVEGCHCKTGSVVVMDPRTGDVLAMASYPSFDPNEPPSPDEPLSHRLNLAISAPFEPGSVFKVITLASALETTRLGPDSPINCLGGTLNLYGRVIHEAKHGFGVMPMRMVLAKSSNIGAIQVGLVVGVKNLHKYVSAFGFGKRTGIPLPAESGGQVFEPRKWGKTSIGSVAMGHEVTTTTIQLAQAASIIANNGMLVRPRIVLRRHRPGDPVEIDPVAPPVRVMDPHNAFLMREMMHDVVLPGGTGTRANVAGYLIGGKTGSAQIYDHNTRTYTHKYNASFMGMVPLNNPRLVIVVTVNGSTGSAGYGGAVSAPVFKDIATAALRLLDIPKDIEDNTMLAGSTSPSSRDDVADVAAAGLGPVPPEAMEDDAPVDAAGLRVASYEGDGPRAPRLIGMTMRDVLNATSAAGIPIEAKGSGIVKAQSPEAGKILQPGEPIVLEFRR